jgi:hypothetical protein
MLMPAIETGIHEMKGHEESSQTNKDSAISAKRPASGWSSSTIAETPHP